MPIDFPETGYKWNQLGLLAQKFYQDYCFLNYIQLLDRLSNANRLLIQIIKNSTNDELYGTHWYGKWTKGRMIQLNTSSRYFNARKRIRNWLKKKNLLN